MEGNFGGLQSCAEEMSYTTVTLPDFFQFFISRSPAINPHYNVVKLESEEWLGG